VIVPGNSDTSSSQMTEVIFLGSELMNESPLNWMPEVAYDTERPIIVLDFKSLYPSIIIARNLCFSTLLIRKNDLPPDSVHEGYGPQECYFASANVKPGVLPAMLIHLLDERVKVKNLMKSTTDASQILVLDGRQRAIKVAANAVYGATGAPSSKLQCLPIAETTIVAGAKSLTMAKELIEERYSDVVSVVYGDTDSVFLKTKTKLSVPDAIE
jgi:DNA polymerase delta subunit 1